MRARRVAVAVCGAILAVVAPVGVRAEEGAPDGSSPPELAGTPDPTPTTIVVLTVPVPAEGQGEDGGEGKGEGEGSPEDPATTIPDATTPETAPDATDPAVTSDAATAADDGSVTTTAATEPDGPPPTPSPGVVEHTRQSVEVAGTATAIARTGGNHSTAPEGATTGGASRGASISTGAATSVGSADQTSVTQQAITTLTGEAIAEVAQVVFVLNVGAAVAGTGANATSVGGGGAGGGQTATGNALAIGNDSTTRVTQGAAGAAPAGVSDRTDQSVVAVHIGLAVADTGVNVIASTATAASSGSAAIDTGAAHAVGNLSATDITQLAQVAASGTATVSINQWATVLNLGLALANSGGNAVGSVLGSVVDRRDQELAEQLVAMLLPALLVAPTGTAGAGAGSIATGDATAIGNRSTTVISQQATAAATGDGSVIINQRAVVANVGAAVANTGGNVTGAGAGVPLGGAAQQVVDDISAALTAFLGRIDAAAAGSLHPGEPLRLTLTVGDVSIDVDATLAGAVLGADAGARTSVRQVTAIFNIGVSRANSGDNVAVVSGDQAAQVAALAAVAEQRALADGPVTVRISTGDAAAANESVLVVCQVDDVSATICDREESPEGEEPPSPAAPSGNVPPPAFGMSFDRDERVIPVLPRRPPTGTTRDSLPATGSDPDGTLVAATLMVAIGLVLVRASRRSAR